MTAVPAMRAVLVTRPGGTRDPLARRLAEAGVRVYAVPTVATRDMAPGGDLDAAAADMAGYDWVVVTSAIAAGALAAALGRVERRPVPERAHGRSMPAARPATAHAGPRFAAVGPATASALREAGMEVTVQAADATGAGLGGALRAGGELAGRRVLLPRASAAAPELPALLRAAGADVREVVAYETVEGPAASRPALAAALADPLLGAIAVASGSAVRGLVALAAMPDPDAAGPTGPAPDLRAAGPTRGAADRGSASPSGLETALRALPFVSIGPSTSAVVRRLDLRLAAEAVAPTVDALADAILETLERRDVLDPRDVVQPRARPGAAFPIADHSTEVRR